MSKPKQFTILPKHLIGSVLIFIVIAVLLYTFIPEIFAWFSQPKPAEVAAVEGAQAFLSTDVDLGRSTWEESVCLVSSTDACAVFKNTFATMVWAGVEKNQVRQSCLATGSKLIREVSAESEQRQIWLVTLDCTNLKTNETNSGEVHVSVIHSDDAWMFERILFEQEVQRAKK